MNDDERKRFSPLAFQAELQAASSQHGSSGKSIVSNTLGDRIEEIRLALLSYGGQSEEDRVRHNELLNRAVLGYPDARAACRSMIQDLLMKRRWYESLPGGTPYESLEDAVFAEVIGLNVLDVLLNEPGSDLEEIQVVGTRVFEVRGGHANPSRVSFRNSKEVERIQQNLVLFNHDRLSPRKRWAEVHLRDGSRVTMTGFGYTSEPTLTIRLFRVKHFSLDALCSESYATMNHRIKAMLLCVLYGQLNTVIIGPTNSGKTNLMKSLIAELPNDERVVTIESRLELMLKRDFPDKNIVEFEIDESDPLHGGRQAFKLALRQTPKRICHAEIRDDDANLYVRACTRGHDGSMTTVHVSRMEDAPHAICDMCMLDQRGMNPDRLVKRITEHVTHVGIEMGLAGGRRRVLRLGEFVYEHGEPSFKDWARYDSASNDWLYPHHPSERIAETIRDKAWEHWKEAWGEQNC